MAAVAYKAREYESVAEMMAKYAAVKKKFWQGERPIIKESFGPIKPDDLLQALVHPVVEMEPAQKVAVRRLRNKLDVMMDALVAVSGFSKEQLRNKNRKGQMTYWRQIGYFVAKMHIGKSYPEVGRFFYKDHTSALHGVLKIKERCESGDQCAKEDVARVIETFEQMGAVNVER